MSQPVDQVGVTSFEKGQIRFWILLFFASFIFYASQLRENLFGFFSIKNASSLEK
jgi:hypothetical protein